MQVQHVCVQVRVARRQPVQLRRLRVDPAQRLQALQQVVLWQRLRQLHALAAAHLRRQHDHTHLLDARVLRQRDAVQQSADLHAQVADGDELAHQVQRQHVRVVALQTGRRRQLLHTQRQVARRDRARAPVSAGGEGLLLVLRGRRHRHLLAQHVRRARRHRHQLRLVALLRLDLRDLLPLLRRCRDRHAQNDVADLRLRQRRH